MNLSSIQNIQLDKQKKILIVIFFVVIAYLDYSFILKAQRAGLTGLQVKVVKLKTDLASLNAGLENMRVQKNNPLALAQKKAGGPSKILTESQIPELLQDISTAANKLEIKISQLRPLRPTQKEIASNQERLLPLLINLELDSDYHNLGRFIQVLESSPVFMAVAELKISTRPTDYLKQKVTMVLKTYVRR